MLNNPFSASLKYRDGLPVLPGAFPVVGHLPAFYKHAPELLRRGQEALGPLFWFYFGEWLLMCCGAEGFELLKNKVTTAYFQEKFAVCFGQHTLLSTDGPVHRHLRSGMTPPFTPRGLTQSRVGALLTERIRERIEGWAERGRVTILHETQALTLDIIFRMIGIAEDHLEEWHSHYQTFFLSALPIPLQFPGSPHHRAAKARRWLDARLGAILVEARRDPGSESLVSALANARDDDGEALSDEELIDNLRFLIFAGHETSASILAWMVIQLSRRPELWDALCDEASKVSDIPLSPAEARGFPFAESLFRETVRLYPPLPLTIRRTTAPVTLYHHRLAPGSLVAVGILTLSLDPHLFPDPERFDPGRWLGRNEPPTPVELSQFGGGPHFCLGYHLAWLEAVQFAVALAKTMSRRGLRPRLADGPCPRPLYLPMTHPSPKTRIEFAAGG